VAWVSLSVARTASHLLSLRPVGWLCKLVININWMSLLSAVIGRRGCGGVVLLMMLMPPEHLNTDMEISSKGFSIILLLSVSSPGECLSTIILMDLLLYSTQVYIHVHSDSLLTHLPAQSP
jgi:hypothetical protein